MSLDSKRNNVWLRLHNSGKKPSPRSARAAVVRVLVRGLLHGSMRSTVGPHHPVPSREQWGWDPPTLSWIGIKPPQGQHIALLSCVRFCHPIPSLPSSLCTTPPLLPALCCLQNCPGCMLYPSGHQDMERGCPQGCSRGEANGSRACSWPSAHITACCSLPVRMLQSEPGRIQNNLCSSSCGLSGSACPQLPNSHRPPQTAAPQA